MPNPLQGKGGGNKANSIYAKTEEVSSEEGQPTQVDKKDGENTQLPTQVAEVSSPSTSVKTVAPLAELQASQPVPVAQTFTRSGLGQPATHDRRNKIPFEERYKKENFMIDRRLLPYVLHWLEHHGRSKVEAINIAWLRLLISDGYPVDPTLLDRHFQFEDVPKFEDLP